MQIDGTIQALREDLVRVAAHLGERRQPARDLWVRDAVRQVEDVS